MIYRQNRCF